jgi:GTPase SAR1 family protein
MDTSGERIPQVDKLADKIAQLNIGAGSVEQHIHLHLTELKAHDESIEPDVKRLFDSLKERYQKRYEEKLSGRFEITLEVSESLDIHKLRPITEEFSTDASRGKAIEVISEVFGETGRLLITGNPGAGKTVLLLKLANDLLSRASLEKKEAFPIILNLAAWSEKHEHSSLPTSPGANFGNWVTRMLVSSYGLSEAFARRLLLEQRIVFLLDGLDELARNEEGATAAIKRAKCMASLNDYLRDGRKAVVCCRIKEFQELRKITGYGVPASAMVQVLDLSKEQVLKALQHARADKEIKHHASANNLLRIVGNENNANLLEVIRTPFYFTTAMEIFDNEIPLVEVHTNQRDAVENLLIEEFVRRKLVDESAAQIFPARKMKDWLKWLAQLMERKQYIIFELDDIQAGGFPRKRYFSYMDRVLLAFSIVLTIDIIGALFFTDLFFMLASIFLPVTVGVTACAIISVIVVAVLDSEYNRKGFIWLDKSKILSWHFGILVPSFWLMNIPFVYGSFSEFSIGLVISLFSSLAFVSYTLLKSYRNFNYLKTPYERMYKEFIFNLSYIGIMLSITLTSFAIGLIYSIFIFPVPEIGEAHILAKIVVFIMLLVIWSIVLTIIVVPYLSISTIIPTAFFQHLILRFCLYIQGMVPLRYATFLDYATSLRILEKDGGQWRFRHQHLQEYFAKLN